jgi:benzodiazapine receptor
VSVGPELRPAMAAGRAAMLAAGLVFFDSLIGQVVTFPNLAPWYAGLAKPGFTPPDAVFGPVWTLLYTLMAVAFWRVLTRPDQPGRRLAIGLFLAQLALNALWPMAFFGARSPLLGLFDIVPQEILVAATLFLFWRLDRFAGLCLLPLLFWAGYAALLNFEMWRLNG